MAKQYTAWVVQEGNGDVALWLGARGRDWTKTPKLKEAIQFARRSDARKALVAASAKAVYSPFWDDFRAVEKQFG